MALTNPADCQLDAFTGGLVKSYNAKPFMCRTTGAYYAASRYFGIEADVHKWGIIALQGLNALKGMIPKM
eukprot:3756544-Prymnesium_polylepis.1